MADYYSYAVIGIEVEEKDIKKELFKRKAFEHNYPESMKFCPDTGQKLWEESEMPAVYFEDGKMYGRDEAPVDLNQYGLKIFTNTDDERRVIGFGIEASEDSDVYFTNAVDYGQIEATLGELLEPYGLWRQHAFGLYVMQRCSY